MQRLSRPAFTLVELLIVVAVVAIFAGLVVTRIEPAFQEQLRAAGEIVAADLHYARSLAVSNNSRYQITFDRTNRRYWLEHSGTTTALNVLPASPYQDASDPSTRHTTNLANLRALGASAEIAAVRRVSSNTQSETTTVEFGPLGALTQAEDCWIWISTGNGDSRRYLPIELDSITGVARVGDLQSTGPPSVGATTTTSSGS